MWSIDAVDDKFIESSIGLFQLLSVGNSRNGHILNPVYFVSSVSTDHAFTVQGVQKKQIHDTCLTSASVRSLSPMMLNTIPCVHQPQYTDAKMDTHRHRKSSKGISANMRPSAMCFFLLYFHFLGTVLTSNCSEGRSGRVYPILSVFREVEHHLPHSVKMT